MIGAWFLGVPTLALAGFALSNSNWIVWGAGAVVNGALIAFLLKFIFLKSQPVYTPVNNDNVD